MKSLVHLMTVAALMMLLAEAPVSGATLQVSSNGADSAACGASNPCATLQQAVANAAAGDLILVGPGRYAGAIVDKKVKLWSSAGTGAAVLTSQMVLATDGITFGLLGKGFSFAIAGPVADPLIQVAGADVTVRGNVLGGYLTGVAVSGAGAIVRDNTLSNLSTGVTVGAPDAIIRDNSFNGCPVAIRIVSSGATVRGNRIGMNLGGSGIVLDGASSGADVEENRITSTDGPAVRISGVGHLLRRNVAQGSFTAFIGEAGAGDVQLVENVVRGSSFQGFAINGGSDWVLLRNAVLGCNGNGFAVNTAAGTSVALEGNTAIGCSGSGFQIQGSGDYTLAGTTAINCSGNGIDLQFLNGSTTVTGGNIYGNGICGLQGPSFTTIAAEDIYWGAASGPGPDPADTACGMVTASSYASLAAPIKLPPVK